MSDSVFVDLRRLADWLNTNATSPERAISPDRAVKRLGRAAVPMLGRELRGLDVRRREVARRALAAVAASGDDARARVISELRAITEQSAAIAIDDDVKVCALGLLSELGERAAARFSDPTAIQRRSASALAGQLATAADVAIAADLMLRQLVDADVGDMIEVMASVAPEAAARLAAELAIRLDASTELHERIAQLPLVAIAEAPAAARRPTRPIHVAVLVDAAARLVVVASRKVIGERRWRRWAVLIDAAGRIDDCLHADDATEGDAAPLIASLVADGYRVASHDAEHAHAIVASAARLTGAARPHASSGSPALGSAYYLGRDLLNLGDAHLGGRAHAHPIATTLGRAVNLLAAGEPARAHALLVRHDPQLASADVAAAVAGCLLAQGRHAEALGPLARALEAEPEWPLHHWNHAAALHALGDAAGSYHALRRFVATSGTPSGLDANLDQPGRIALAERLIAELERTSRLRGTPLRRSRSKKKKS